MVPRPESDRSEKIAAAVRQLESENLCSVIVQNQQVAARTPTLRHFLALRGSFGSSDGVGTRCTSEFEKRTTSPSILTFLWLLHSSSVALGNVLLSMLTICLGNRRNRAGFRLLYS